MSDMPAQGSAPPRQQRSLPGCLSWLALGLVLLGILTAILLVASPWLPGEGWTCSLALLGLDLEANDPEHIVCRLMYLLYIGIGVLAFAALKGRLWGLTGLIGVVALPTLTGAWRLIAEIVKENGSYYDFSFVAGLVIMALLGDHWVRWWREDVARKSGKPDSERPS